MVREDGELALHRLIKPPQGLEQPSIIVDIDVRTIDIHLAFKSPMGQAGCLV
jgi:hypothetical protein